MKGIAEDSYEMSSFFSQHKKLFSRLSSAAVVIGAKNVGWQLVALQHSSF